METPSSNPAERPVVVVPPASSRSGSRVFWWLAGAGMLCVAGLTLLLLVALVAAIGADVDKKLDEKYHSLSKTANDKIAIILIDGAILKSEGFVKQQIDAVKEDKHVKAVVLRIDSPGGTVSASDYLYHHLRELVDERELPIVVSMGGVCASGGYYIAMAVGDTPDTIFAEPTTWTGSIGVVIPHYDLSGLMESIHVEEDSIKSHRLKQMGSPFKPMTEEERKIFEGLVNDGFERFKKIVRAGRPYFRTHESDLDAVATGQVFTTPQALGKRLVDKEGFVEAAIDRAIELAKLDRDNVKVIKYKEPFRLFGGILAGESRATFDVSQLAGALSPRSYYLWSWPSEMMQTR